jgi:hypothetical protein
MKPPEPPVAEETVDIYECEDQTIYYTIDDEQIVVLNNE